jgi:DNA-binding SARP family transcriptional activator
MPGPFLSLSLLGGFRARRDPKAEIPVLTRKGQALLAYLALHPGHAQPRNALAALLWPDSNQRQARHSLRQTLSVLREALESVRPPALVSRDDTVGLNPSALSVDVLELERLARQRSLRSLEEAAALYQGDLLAGLDVGAGPFEEWLRGERERLRYLALDVLTRLLVHYERDRNPETAIRMAQRLIALDPVREEGHRALMRLYDRQGQRGAALRQYQLCAEILRRELDMEPEPETRRLHDALRPSLDRARVGRAGARTRRRAATRQPSRNGPSTVSLVGRLSELQELRALLAQARQGQGRVVVITGEAGIGKSRLVEELASETRQRAGAVLTGHCYDMTQILPFGAWTELLRQGTALVAGRPSHHVSVVWRAELARLLPEIGEEGLQPTSGNEDLLRLFEAVAHLLIDVAADGLLLVVLEDLHWADEMSLRLLSFLARRLSATPVLLVGTVREEDLRDNSWARRALVDLEREPGTTRITLGPLDQADTTRLVRNLTGSREPWPLESLATRLWETSRGNPLVIVETMRALSEAPSTTDYGASLPRRVRDLIAARLDRLVNRDRQLLAAAAVAGGDIDFRLVQRVSGLDDIAAAEAAEELILRRILQRRDERLSFAHDRIRDVALDAIGPLQRVPLHRTIARVLEDLHRDDLAPHYLALGTHYRAGRIWDRAAHYLRQAGVHAYTRWANREAVACFEQAIAALNELPRIPETITEGVELRLDLRRALTWLDEPLSAMEWLNEAEALATETGDSRQLGMINVFLSTHLMDLFDYVPAVARAERGFALAETAGDLGLEAEACYNAGRLYYYLGNYPRARTLLIRAVAVLEEDRERERAGLATRYIRPGRWVVGHFGRALLLTLARYFLGHTLGLLGALQEARSLADAALEDAESLEQAGGMATVLTSILRGSLHLTAGEFAQGVFLLERAVATCRTNPANLAYFVSAGAMLAFAYARTGQVQKAQTLLDETLERSAAVRARAPRRIALLSETCLWVGRRAEAEQIAQAELTGARKRGERGYEALVLRTLGEISLWGDPPTVGDAVSYYRASLELAEELGMRPLQARAHLGLAHALRLEDDPTAMHHRQTAVNLFREIGLELPEINIPPDVTLNPSPTSEHAGPRVWPARCS